MTVLPDLVIAGVATVVAGSALAAWSLWFVDRRSGPLGLLLLSLVLLLVGGGLAPPVMGVIAAVAATRINAPSRRPPGRSLRALSRHWVWLVVVAVVGYLSLVPGLVVVAGFGVTPPDGLIYGIAGASYLGLVLGLIAARARDRGAALDVTPRRG